MTLVKGYTRISIKKSVEARLVNIKKLMEKTSPDKYDENTGYSVVVDWLIDEVLKYHVT